jgi:hypothetical protein
MALRDDDLRAVGRWAANCAARALPLFELRVPADARPREAIEAIRAYASGGARTGALRARAWAAYAAARETGDPVATAAARAAGLAAATAYLHPLVTPHQSKHVLGPAAYGVRARELATPGDDARDDEVRWAIAHASPLVRDVIRRLPARAVGRGPLDAVLHRLDVGLRSDLISPLQ